MDELSTTDYEHLIGDISRARLKDRSGPCVDETVFPDTLARLQALTGFRPELFMIEHDYEGKWMEVNGVSFSEPVSSSTPGVS